LELVIDGARVASRGPVSLDPTSSTPGLSLVGCFTSSSFLLAVPDFVPFDSSAEVFLTSSAGISGIQSSYAFWIDIHQ